MRLLCAALAWVVGGTGCLAPDASKFPAANPSELRPGGDTTVALGAKPSFVLPAANLPQSSKTDFYAGKALATQPWVRAPTTTDARDGLGPLYNARSCLACHIQGGRGETTAANGKLGRATLARLGLPGRDPHTGGPVAEPTYGGQLQPQSTSLAHQLRGHSGARALEGLRGEATLEVQWIEAHWRYPDGTEVALRRPEVVLTGLAYGPLHEDVEIGLRHAPGLAGVGLLELVPQSALAALEDPDDTDDNGISGRQNMVWDPERNTTRPGRFGLKANQPSVRVQVAAAFAGDMGITSPIFPEQPCTGAQLECSRSPHGTDEDGFEISEALLQLVVDFDMHLGVVARRAAEHPSVSEGREQFYAAGCAD
ncbi:MAG: di-heme oxidoredictase family protein, partial [Myxococcota bacterium]